MVHNNTNQQAWKIFVGILWISTLGLSPALAQEAIPVGINVKIQSPNLILKWGSKVSEIQEKLSSHFVGIFQNEYKHWDFLKPKSEKVFKAVSLKISEPETHKIHIGMYWIINPNRKENEPVEEKLIWDEIWLTPGAWVAGQRPSKSTALKKLKEKSSSFFSPIQRQKVRDLLYQKVPLGGKGRWQGEKSPSTILVISSLGWDRFKRLEGSRFRVKCKSEEQNVDIPFKGTDDHLTYKSDSGQAYEGLVLKPEKVNGNSIEGVPLDKIGTYQVSRIYLTEEGDPADDDFFSDD